MERVGAKVHGEVTRFELPLANELERQLIDAGITGYEREAQFIEGRKYRADYLFPLKRLIVECDGSTWVQGTGHNSGMGKNRDCIRDCEATIAGWHTMRFTTNLIRDGEAVKYIQRYLNLFNDS